MMNPGGLRSSKRQKRRGDDRGGVREAEQEGKMIREGRRKDRPRRGDPEREIGRMEGRGGQVGCSHPRSPSYLLGHKGSFFKYYTWPKWSAHRMVLLSLIQQFHGSTLTSVVQNTVPQHGSPDPGSSQHTRTYPCIFLD